jgi:Ca2+-binding EF-hand superfamily protein
MAQLFRRTAIGFALALSLPMVHAAQAADPMTTIDTDRDNVIDINEARAAAAKKFVVLDTDKDAMLDHAEMKGHMAGPIFRVADTDNDKLLDKGEYMALVEKRFKAADTDNDGKIDAQELKTPAGKSLLALL